MTGVDFHISVKGIGEIETRLAAIAERGDDMRPLMDEIGVILEEDARDNFEGEHDPDGVPWLPAVRVQEHGGKTLQLTRRLFLSLTHRAGRDRVEVGTNLPYARRHQEGFSGVEKVRSHRRRISQAFGRRLSRPIDVIVGSFTRTANTPKRAFLGMSADARADILDAGERYMGAA